ncbi:hypothetical protein [Flagellimonas allohymeniacidonis]|uniref:Anti-sigma factor n=1 Tax=Flagellimonas allohymeniacidonis TaxID=2517819 RepID=A0A4Q8QE38_9FLAO|nr:hypothetical protein [Allomuricauda hymeniacidonis]TAI48752.1 hypothetical protein EW142_02830 [Allomuricauda hymeniacidonis]
MDNFEKHIRENTAQFDEHKANRDKLWANISEELHKPKTKVIPLWKRPLLRIAASVAVVLGIATMGFLLVPRTTMENQFVSEELLEIDMHYQSLVSYQVQLVQDNPNLSEMDKQEFLSFMDELDAEYETLRKEMRKNLDNERVLEAIVANYKKRIELIENLLRQINDAKKPDEDYGYTL